MELDSRVRTQLLDIMQSAYQQPDHARLPNWKRYFYVEVDASGSAMQSYTRGGPLGPHKTPPQ